MTVENTDPRFPWLTNWVETLLSQLWYPCTVGAISANCRELMEVWADAEEEATGKSPINLDYKLHDFGVRGASSMESAALGGAAHLMNFKGTDNVPALLMLRKFYGADMPGESIAASEHSTITSWGRENEAVAMENMLTSYASDATIACVSDSYDINNACSKIVGS